MSEHHVQIPVRVWADIDTGIADMVRYLNTIPGVRTMASCQGTIGEGGPAPYRPQVMASWPTELNERLAAEFDITMLGDQWGYLHPSADIDKDYRSAGKSTNNESGGYSVILTIDAEGDIIAEHPELPGCVAHGSTLAEAIEYLSEVRVLWLEMSAEQGENPPTPITSEIWSAEKLRLTSERVKARRAERLKREAAGPEVKSC